MSGTTNTFERFRFDTKRARDSSDSTEPQPALSPSPPSRTNSQARKKQREVPPSTPAVTTPTDAVAPASSSQSLTTASPPLRSKWQERWHSICDACFAAHVECTHYDERALRLLIVGHNPSDHAWQSGFSYSNPTNRMWRLIVGDLAPLSWRGILPLGSPVTTQNVMGELYGVGFTSIGLEPGNDAAKYNSATMAQWKSDFFRRLRAHTARVCATQHAEYKTTDDASSRCDRVHGPLLIAFSGKRQFSYMFTPPLAKVEHYGPQTRLPHDWPHDVVPASDVWVLPSSSGRSALSHVERSTPYRLLADRMHAIPWPLVDPTDHTVDTVDTIKHEPVQSEHQ